MNNEQTKKNNNLEHNKEIVRLEADGKTLVINLSIQDEELYHFLQKVEEEKRAERLVNALRIGILGLKRMGVGENVDYVEKEFNSMLSKFEKMFDPSIETSHLGKLSALFKEYFDQGGKVESIFDPMNGNSPLSKLRKELLEEINKIRDILVKKEAKEEVLGSTPLKGYEFEDTCEEILSGFICRDIGGILQRTTKKHGEITGSFAGDFVVAVQGMSSNKIVFETKDSITVTQPQIIENLRQAMKNRGAKYAIFVSKYKEALPKKIGWFNEFHGNMLVCALGSRAGDTFFPEIINIAYQWAKLRLYKESSIQEEALVSVAEGVVQIGEKLDKFSQLQTQCTNIDKATKEIRALSVNLRNDIAEQVEKIQRAISSFSEECKITVDGG